MSMTNFTEGFNALNLNSIQIVDQFTLNSAQFITHSKEKKTMKKHLNKLIKADTGQLAYRQ